MANFDFKSATPATLTTAGFLFGATSQGATTPSILTASFTGTGALVCGASPTLTGVLTLSGGTVTSSAPALDISQTWNAGGVAFTGLKFNATSTASASASLLMDLQTGGVSQFTVSKAGVVTSANGTLVSGMTDTWSNGGTQYNSILMNVTNSASAASSALLNLQIAGEPYYRFVKERRLQVFNTFTSEAIYEAGEIYWSSNVLKIGTSKGASGGSGRDVYIATPDYQWTFSNANGAMGTGYGGIYVPSGFNGYQWTGSGGLTNANADGVFRLLNNNGDPGSLIFGIQTTGFPRLSGLALTGGWQLTLKDSANANGQSFNVCTLTELTTIAASAFTDTTIQMPDNSVVIGVSVRVTTALPITSTFTVGDAGSAARFSTAAVSKASGSTDPGTKAAAYYNATAASVRITPDSTPSDNTGRVRVTIQYFTVTPPTS